MDGRAGAVRPPSRDHEQCPGDSQKHGGELEITHQGVAPRTPEAARRQRASPTPHRQSNRLPVDALMTSKIRSARIIDRYDDLLRTAGSLKRGSLPASLLISRLQAASSAAALAECGRLVRTNFLLAYLADAPLRRRIGAQLNKSETMHALHRHIAFGATPAASRRRRRPPPPRPQPQARQQRDPRVEHPRPHRRDRRTPRHQPRPDQRRRPRAAQPRRTRPRQPQSALPLRHRRHARRGTPTTAPRPTVRRGTRPAKPANPLQGRQTLSNAIRAVASAPPPPQAVHHRTAP